MQNVSHFIYYILGYNVSRETLSCVIFYSIYKMFHVKHFIYDNLDIVMQKDICVSCFVTIPMLGLVQIVSIKFPDFDAHMGLDLLTPTS